MAKHKPGDWIRFIAKYEDGSSDDFWIDRWTLSRGDHVAFMVAREHQAEKKLPPGTIVRVKRG
jgi:hypothetical protein